MKPSHSFGRAASPRSMFADSRCSAISGSRASGARIPRWPASSFFAKRWTRRNKSPTRKSRDAPRSARSVQGLANGLKHPVDLRLFHDQRRRERNDVAGHPDQHARLERLEKDLVGALAGRPGTRLELDAGDEAAVADVDHVLAALQGVRSVFPVAMQGSAAREKPFLF